MGQIPKMHLSIEQLEQLRMKREEMAEAIIEIQSRISVIDEAMSWSAVGADSSQEAAAGVGDIPWVRQ